MARKVAKNAHEPRLSAQLARTTVISSCYSASYSRVAEISLTSPGLSVVFADYAIILSLPATEALSVLPFDVCALISAAFIADRVGKKEAACKKKP